MRVRTLEAKNGFIEAHFRKSSLTLDSRAIREDLGMMLMIFRSRVKAGGKKRKFNPLT